MHAEVIKIRKSTGQRVVLSCQRSLANFVLKRQITNFALFHPEVQLVVRIGKQEDVIEDVREGVADVGCFLSNDETRGLRSEVIGNEKLVLVASPSHLLAGRKRIKASEIQRWDFVAPPPSSLFGRAVTKLLASVGINDIKVAAPGNRISVSSRICGSRCWHFLLSNPERRGGCCTRPAHRPGLRRSGADLSDSADRFPTAFAVTKHYLAHGVFAQGDERKVNWDFELV